MKGLGPSAQDTAEASSACGASFKDDEGLGFRGLGFRGFRFRGLGFGGLGFRDLGLRV